MRQYFLNKDALSVAYNVIDVIIANKQRLSDIDGETGDGDHGINMSKGFSLAKERLDPTMNFADSMSVISDTLLQEIGGSMGPLYGVMFDAFSDVTGDYDQIDKFLFHRMIVSAIKEIKEIGNAEIGDKTLLDTIIPALMAFESAMQSEDFNESLMAFKMAAIKGSKSTKDMIAKVGRASRLGERSRGHLDAGAMSCALIITTMADSIGSLLINEER